jgi:hypothetical protein
MIELKDFRRLKIKPGEVVFIRPKIKLTQPVMASLHKSTRQIAAECGIKIVLLPFDFQVGVINEQTTAT